MLCFIITILTKRVSTIQAQRSSSTETYWLQQNGEEPFSKQSALPSFQYRVS